MVRSLRTPLLVTFTAVVATGAPAGALLAQRAEISIVRRTPRAEPADSNERQLRRLELRADSLSQLYNEGEDLSTAQRRAVGQELDRTVAQIEVLSRRMAQLDSRMVRVQVEPMVDERSATAMSNALRQARESHFAMPRGWLGIVVSGTAREPRVDNGELIIRYLTHPVIVSVEPSSPAERAGLTPSDTLLAYDGRDVRDRDISLTRLLRPNSRVLVRIRRDGKTKDVPVTIADVPSRIRLRSESNFEMRAAQAPLPDAVVFPRAGIPSATFVPRAPLAPRPAMTQMPPMPAMPSMPVTPDIIGYGLNTVAGAQLVPLTQGLARTVGMSQGVLVTLAALGSPAYSSGLRDGDVIVRVAGDAVSTVAAVRERVRAVFDNGDSEIELEVMREKKPRKVILRWNR